jgi:hypothetical protein
MAAMGQWFGTEMSLYRLNRYKSGLTLSVHPRFNHWQLPK